MEKNKAVIAKPRILPPLWRQWKVRWEFFTRLYASVPADPEIIEAWLRSRQPRAQPPGGRSIDEIQEEVLVSLAEEDKQEDKIKGSYLVFQYTEVDGQRPICLRADNLRAHCKDCARVISAQYMGRIDGERAFSTKVINGLYPDPRRHWIEVRRPDGMLILKPDGEEDRFVHPRYGDSALKRLQFIDPPSAIEYILKTLGDSIKQDDLEKLFQYGGVHGFGGERSRDGGKYLATFKEV